MTVIKKSYQRTKIDQQLLALMDFTITALRLK